MLPIELKKDKDGLFYIEDDRILMHTPLLIDHREISEDRYYQNGFYRLNNNDEYIIKYSYTVFTKKEQKFFKEMLHNFACKQNMVSSVDFPIGYLRFGKNLVGLIIKYYKDGISYNDILKNKDIKQLSEYYMHDEDAIHNVFLLFDEVLNSVYEMYENGIYYGDLNSGNIILTNNQAKLIDFDPNYVKFDDKDKRIRAIMYGYCHLLNDVLTKYNLVNGIDESFTDFDDAKQYTKKLENNIRRG